ncbi:MAG: transcriptional regulator [Rhodobacterales bacterium]|nr:MAG: transcriptional regulator [Rhodobacterales bacterium]
MGERAGIGIDIGGTHLRAARVREGRIEARAEAPSSGDAGEVLARCLALVEKVRSPEAEAIGIGIPGQVDALARRVISGGFVDLSGVDFRAEIEAAAGLPVAVENDATMALIAEAAFGAARGQANVVMLTIGTGIGGAILEAGRILRGRRAAGQLGHIVVDPAGEPCLCGRRGCVETTSSGTALGRLIAGAGLPAGTRIEALLAGRDAGSRGVIAAWAAPLRRAIDSLIAVLNPGLVLLGGGLGPAACAALETVPEAKGWYHAPVRAARLGDDAGVIGAARAGLGGAHARRVVLVNGVPASGKSRLARALADATGWPLLALDTIKAPFLAGLPPGDRLFNRTLGRASHEAIFDTIAAAPPGAGFIVDAWFGFQPVAVLEAGLARAGVGGRAEIWCHAPPEVIGARYAARVPERPPGHPGTEYVPELVALAARARPTGLAPVLRVETTAGLDLPRVTQWLGEVL